MQLRSKWKIRIISVVMVLCMIVVGIQSISVSAENTEAVSSSAVDVEEEKKGYKETCCSEKRKI